MPRTSQTSELTTKTVNALNAMAQQYGIADFNCVASGNTIKIGIPGLTNPEFADGFDFAFSARTPAGKVAIGETKYSKEECISAIALFIAETGIQASNKYDKWSKADEQKNRVDENGNAIKIPNTHAILLTLGNWPATTITKLMITGKINDTEPDEIIAMQEEYNKKNKEEVETAKAEAEKRKAEKAKTDANANADTSNDNPNE